jgi:hypothetical protein
MSVHVRLIVTNGLAVNGNRLLAVSRSHYFVVIILNCYRNFMLAKLINKIKK